MPVSTTATRTGFPPLVVPVYPAWCAAHALVRRIPFGAISTAWSVRDSSTCVTRGLCASAAAASAEPENAKPSNTCVYTATTCPPCCCARPGASARASAPGVRVTIHVPGGDGGGPIGSTAAAATVLPARMTTVATRSAWPPAFHHCHVRIGECSDREGPPRV